MSQQPPESEGLQVDARSNQAIIAPEVVPYNQAIKAPEVVPYNQNTYVPSGYETTTSKGQKPPFGLGLWAFAGLVALLTALIVGAGVGGGLGAALANKSSSCQEDTTSASSPANAEPTSCPTQSNNTSESDKAQSNNTSENDKAPYVPKPASEVTSLQLICPDNKRNETKYKSRKGHDFRWWCGVDASWGDEAKQGGSIVDFGILAYTIDDCMEACSNVYLRGSNGWAEMDCRSIVFSINVARDISERNGNCWIKNGSKTTGSKWGFNDDTYAYAEIID